MAKLCVESIALFWSLKCVHPVLIKARSILTKDNNMPLLNLPKRLAALPLILLVLTSLVLQGCFHDDDDPAPVVVPVPDATPAGYYTNTGTASVSDGAGGTLSITDLQAMVNGNRIMMMSTTEELLYDGTITDISGNDFTADFTIYYRGEKPTESTATVTGQITEGSSITGTLIGSGVGSGTFSLLYASTNSEVAAISRIENGPGKTDWLGAIGFPGFEHEFAIDNAGVLLTTRNATGRVFDSCDFAGTITPIGGSSLYSVSVSLSGCNSGAASEGSADGDYTGFASSRSQTNPDDRLVFAVSDGRYSPNTDFFY